MAFRPGEDLYYITYEMVPAPGGRGVPSMPMGFSYTADPDWKGVERTASTREEIRTSRRTSTLRTQDEFLAAQQQNRGYEKGKVYSVGEGTYVRIKSISKFNPATLTSEQWAKISDTERWSVDYLVGKYGDPEVLTQANTTPGEAKTPIDRMHEMVTFSESQESGYPPRTKANIDGSDLTISYAIDGGTAGEKLTRRLASEALKMHVELSPYTKTEAQRVKEFALIVDSFSGQEVEINIAGNGEYTEGMPSTQALADEIALDLAFLRKKGVGVIAVRSGGQTGADQAGIMAAIELGIKSTVLAPKGWVFRDVTGTDIRSRSKFIERFVPKKMPSTKAAATPEITKNLPVPNAAVAQGIEQGTSKPLAAGSNPAGGATTADGTPLPQPQGDRPIAEIVAERLNEFADMRAIASRSARFTGGRRAPIGPASPSLVASNLDRTVGALGPFGETYETKGGEVAGIDQTRTIASRLSALFQSIGYTPDGNGGEFLKGNLVPSNDLVADVMGEMISAIKSLNRSDSPLTVEHRAELGAIILELSRVLHDVADPRTREALKRVTRKPTISTLDGKKPNRYFGTTAEGADVFYPGGATDPFGGLTTGRPNAQIRRIAAAQIGQVPSSSQGEEPSVNRPLAIDQAGIYPELDTTLPGVDITRPVQISRLQQAVDESGVYGETDKAALNVEVNVDQGSGDYERIRSAISRTAGGELGALLDLDGLMSGISGVSSLSPLERGDFGSPIAFRTDVPYRSNLFVRRRTKEVRYNPSESGPESLRRANTEYIIAEANRRIARAKVLYDAIDAQADSQTVAYTAETQQARVSAKARIRSWINESVNALRDGNVATTRTLLDDYETIMDMGVGERTGLEQLGYSQEALISKVKATNRTMGDYALITVQSKITIKTPAYARAASDKRRGAMSLKYDRLVADFGEEFANAYMAGDEAATMYGDKVMVGDTITIAPGDYVVPVEALPAFEGTDYVYDGVPLKLKATITVSPEYIVLQNGTIVRARSQEDGFISHRKVLPFRVREVDGGIFSTGKGGLGQERGYQIERLDPNSYETSDPSVRNDRDIRDYVIRTLDKWYGSGDELFNMLNSDDGAERYREMSNETGTLVTDLEEIIASDAYSALEILAANGDSFPALESELLRAVAEVHGEIRADRIPQYSKYRLGGVPTVDRGGLRGAVYRVHDAVRAVLPGVPQLESKMGVQTVDDILNLESRLAEPIVIDDNININSVRRGVSFLYRLAYESGIQLGYGGVGTSTDRKIIIADNRSAKALIGGDLGVIEQINDAGLLAARAAVEAAKAILHSGWSEGLDPKYSRNRFETTPSRSMDTREASLRILNYIPGMEDTGITLSPTDTSTSLYAMRASGALGDKATKFFDRYFDQAGLMDPKNQGPVEVLTSEDSIQIMSELEAAYRAIGSRLQTADQTPIEFRVLERETPGEATLRVLRAIAAVDERAREIAKLKSEPVTPAPNRNITAFDATDGLTDEGVLIESKDDYSWSDYGDETGFVPMKYETSKSGRRHAYTTNGKRLSKIIAYKLNSLGGISKDGVRDTLKQIFLDEEAAGILPSSREDLDKLFIEVYKDLSERMQSQGSPTVLVKQVIDAAGAEFIGPLLLRVSVNAEPDHEGRPQLDVVVKGNTGKVQKIRVTKSGKGLIPARELLPILRKAQDEANRIDLELFAKPIYEAMYDAAPITDRSVVTSIPSGPYQRGPYGGYYQNVITSIERGLIPVQEVRLPDDLTESYELETLKRSENGEPVEGATELDANDMDAILRDQYDGPGIEQVDNESMMMAEAVNKGKLAALLRPDQGFGMLGPRARRFDVGLRTPIGGGVAGAAIDIGMAAAGGYLTPENAILSAGLNATNLLSKSPLKAGLIGSVASLGVTVATGGDIGRTIFGIAGSIAGGVLGGAFTGGIGAFGGSVGGSLVADELWKSMFGQQQSNNPLFKPFNPGANTPTVRIP